MTRIPARLPPHLHDRPFSLATGLRSGLSLGGMRHSELRRPYPGVRSPAAPPATESVEEATRRAAREYLPRLRVDSGERFSHTTALILHGAPIRMAHTELHVTIPLHHGPARSSGVHGHSSATAIDAAYVSHDDFDFPCVPAHIALLQSAPLLTFRELVVAVDHLIRWWNGGTAPPIIAHDELKAILAGSSARGIRRLRAAVEVARIGSESRMETLLHYELAKRGVDTLELQGILIDEHGDFIGRFDSLDRKKRRIIEYDGEQHRTDRKQYLRDERRLEAARDQGYTILRLHKEELREEVIANTADRMCRFLGEEPRAVPAHLARYFAEAE